MFILVLFVRFKFFTRRMKITRFRDLKSKQMIDSRLKHRLIYNDMQN